MAPIRVGLIGLSTINPTPGGNYTPGTWAHTHLEVLQASPHYQVTALCNSTLDKARESIEFHKLGPNVKPYGSAEELASDPEVDLVVVSVSLKKHLELAKPALMKSKMVFVEFPIAASLDEVEELATLAKKTDVRSIIGSQAVADPAFCKLREIVKGGTIGTVLSSTWSVHSPMVTTFGWPAAYKESLMLNGGTGVLDVVMGHALAPFVSILGEFRHSHSIAKVSNKTTKLVDGKGGVVDAKFPVDAPDTIMLHGELESGGLACVLVKSSRGTVGDVGFRWVITGTEGEVELMARPGFVQALREPKIMLKAYNGDAVEEVKLADTEPDHVGCLQARARNLGRMYEGFATNDEGCLDLEAGLKVHKLLHQVKTELQ